MPNTTNYNWDIPADTDLVKDGAAAIRTLGSSIDTTTKNLNPSTTLGDIEYRSSTANVNTRLAIGTTGQVLSVSGGVPAWTSISSGALTLLSTTTPSGQTTAITNISQDYTNLVIKIYGITAGGSTAWISATPRNGTTDLECWGGGRSVGLDFTSANSVLYLANAVPSIGTADTDFSSVIKIYNYTSTNNREKLIAENTYFYNRNNLVTDFCTSSYVINSTNPVNGLFLDLTSTRTFAAGTIKIYGEK